MKAIQIQEFGTLDVLQFVEIDTPTPKADEVLIKVEAVSVNYSDIIRRRNETYPFPTQLPYIPGGEVAGTIEAVGDDVTHLSAGMRVFGIVGHGQDGYAQYATTPAVQVAPIPDGMSFEIASTLPIAGTTAMLVLSQMADLQAGETVFIQGAAGGVGSYAIQIARAMGARKIIGGTSSSSKLDKIMSLGADVAVDYSADGWVDRVREATNGQGVNVILEMHGGQVFAHSLDCLAPFGRVVVYGMSSREPLTLDTDTIERFFYNPALNQSLHVFNLGLWLGMHPEKVGQALQTLITHTAQGDIEVNIDTVLPLSCAKDAHHMIETGTSSGKIILHPWENE
ncbi:MAG: NADPH:quinone oxidoreductase family protein [Chloroflexota bacterium]